MKKHFLFFFLDDFHNGAVNHVFHFVGFTLLGYGLGRPSIVAIILSPIIMELGHFYNYSKGIHKEYAIKIIPLQWLGWIIFIAFIYILTKLTNL